MTNTAMLPTATVMAREVGRRKRAAPVQVSARRKALTRLTVCWVSCSTWAFLAVVPAAQAAQWRGTLNLDASETFTDNVSLVPAGLAKSDFITQISPGFSLRGVGPRLDVSVDYALRSFTYAQNTDLNHTDHVLSANLKSELAKNWLFLDANAAIAQQNISLLGPIGVNNNASNANRSEVRTYLISPYIRDRFASFADYEVRYQYDTVSSDSNSLSNSSANKFSATMTSGPAFYRYTWDLKLYKETDYYQQSADQNQENVTGNLRYFLTPRFALTGGTGYEKFDYLTVGNKPEGAFWNAGILWRPSPLTSLTLSGGHRFYGPSYALDFSHRSRRLLWRWSYSEAVNTARSNFVNPPQGVSTFGFLSSLVGAGISDPTLRAQIINQIIAQRGLPSTLPSAVNFFSNRAFLEKRADGSLTYNSAKTTSVLSIFRDIRDAKAIGSLSTSLFGTDDFSNSLNIRQQGMSALFNWAFLPRTNADINFGYVDTLFRDSGEEDRLKFIRLGLRHQMSRKVTGAIDYRYTQRDSNVPGVVFQENAVDASINVRF